MKTKIVALITGITFGLSLFAGVASADPNTNGCPAGWTTQGAGLNDPYDKNGDGIICTKDTPGDTTGNSENRPGAVEAGHVDGHNHKDNNNPNGS